MLKSNPRAATSRSEGACRETVREMRRRYPHRDSRPPPTSFFADSKNFGRTMRPSFWHEATNGVIANGLECTLEFDGTSCKRGHRR